MCWLLRDSCHKLSIVLFRGHIVQPIVVGTNKLHHYCIIVVGGGITGLSIAYILSKSNYDVTVLEADSKFGGLLNTFEVGNNKLEFYYHHFFTHDKEINWMINELGLNDKLIYN